MTQHSGEDFFESVEQQLVAATERGISRRRWRWPWLMRARLPWRAPTVGIAAGVAATLAASAIAATLTLPASHHHRADAAAGASRTRSFTTAGAVPAGFQPQSFTAISEFTWWLLGRARCGSHECTAIVRTTDGGPHFVRIAAPPTQGVSQVRFATGSIGYAYGPQLWSTHDGGRTWQEEAHLGATDLATAGGYVYALADTGAAISTLARSPIGRDHWTFLPEPGRAGSEGGAGPSGLWVQGSTVIVQVGRHAWISNDNGDHFTRAPGVVPGACQFDATVDAVAIWGLCMTGMALDDVILSTDSGNSFNSTTAVPDGPLQAFAASSASSAVVAGQGPLLRTIDGGAVWLPVAAPSADWTYLGFTDSTHGVALGNFGIGGHQDWRLYYTIDAGASYHYVPIGPT